jgi:transketolase
MGKRLYLPQGVSSVTGLSYEDLPGFMTMMTGDEKHSSSATSTLDVLWVLYDRIMRIAPAKPSDPDRDRFLLSKGHGPMAYYAVLAAKGFIPVESLPTFGDYDSALGQHPDRVLIPGVEIGSGSLGHGLPIAAGMAAALRAADSSPARVFCLVGDAELDEGSNHEAICLAGRLGLERLTVIAIDNHSATHGWPGGIPSRFELEGWSTAEGSGRDHHAIEEAILVPHPNQPHLVVASVEPWE